MKEHEILHKATFGEDSNVDALGNPDQGQGWYSKTLNLKDWHAINTAQRIGNNYVEWWPVLIIFTFICGLFYTNVALVCVWIVLLGRIIYSCGYQKSTKSRLYGFPLIVLPTFAMMIMSFVGIF